MKSGGATSTVALNVPELLWKFHDGDEPYWQSSVEFYERTLTYQIGLREGTWVLMFGVNGSMVEVREWDKEAVVEAFKCARFHLGKTVEDPMFRTKPGTL